MGFRTVRPSSPNPMVSVLMSCLPCCSGEKRYAPRIGPYLRERIYRILLTVVSYWKGGVRASNSTNTFNVPLWERRALASCQQVSVPRNVIAQPGFEPELSVYEADVLPLDYRAS